MLSNKCLFRFLMFCCINIQINAQEIIDFSLFKEDMRISCSYPDGSLGQDVASGDINGDGYDDILAGAEVLEKYFLGGGGAFIIFGDSPPPRFIETKQTSHIVTLWGNSAQDYTGFAVDVFDFDGDRIDDIFIGTPQWVFGGNGEGKGKIYILLGQSLWPREIFLENNPVSKDKYTIQGQYKSSCLGYVLGHGDFDGDGFQDLLTAAVRGRDDAPQGRQLTAYVLFGGQPLESGLINDLQIRMCCIYQPSFDRISTMFKVGDLDADGFADLFLAYPDANANGLNHCGMTYIIWGRPNLPSTIDLSNNELDHDITIISSDRESSAIGRRFALGDFNGNHFPDVAISYAHFEEFPGVSGLYEKIYTRIFYDLFQTRPKSFCFFDPSLSHLDITSTQVSQTVSFYDMLFTDWDIDGVEDFVFSNPYAYRPPFEKYGWEGWTYVLYGGQDFPDTVDVSPPNGPFRMTTIMGGSQSAACGFSLAMGDINGDKVKDLIMGAEMANTTAGDAAGEVYVLLNKKGQVSPGIPPTDFRSSNPFPNPFFRQTSFRFELPSESNIRIYIIDIMGRVVRNILTTRLEAGTHWVRWDGRDEKKIKVPTGIYLFIYEAENYKEAKKVLRYGN